MTKTIDALLCAPFLTAARAETADERAVRELEEGVALVQTKQGFDAYAAQFHADYSNWSGGQAPLDRARFLAGVKQWHAGGGHALAVRWQLFRTHFETEYQGPTAQAPAL